MMDKSQMIAVVETLQAEFCREREYACDITHCEEKVGFAIETQGKIPVNGLRHRRVGDTSGWYIWCGEECTSDPNFFSPLHALHLLDRCPEIIRLLGLPPGYRFLVAGDYLDIWFDETLVSDESNEDV